MTFRFSDQQFAEFRKQNISKRLATSFDTAPGFEGRVDQDTGDVFATDSRGHSTKFGIDQFGLVGSQKTPLGRQYSFKNNADAKLESMQTPSGASTEFTYSDDGSVASISRKGNRACQLSYDVYRELSSIKYEDGTERSIKYRNPEQPEHAIDRLGNVECFKYSDDHLLTTIIDKNGNPTKFNYEQWNRPTQTVFGDGDTEEFSYDENGHVSGVGRNGNQTAKTVVDDQGRLVEAVYSDGTFKRFQYDSDGRIGKAENENGVVEFAYNSDGQVVSENQNGNVVSSEFSKEGCLLSVTHPNGHAISYTYDPDNRLQSIENWQNGTAWVTYLPDDKGHTLQLPNGVTHYIRTTQYGLIRSIECQGSTNEVLSKIDIAYDSEDRVEYFRDSEYELKKYTYDAENQLLSLQRKSGEYEKFAYDPCGNRVAESGVKLTVNKSNQITAGVNGAIAYDERGNVVQLVTSVGTVYLSYNLQNQLVQTESSAGMVDYGYDAFGRRIWKKIGVKTTRFIYNGNQLIDEIVEREGLPTISRSFSYYPHSTIPVAVLRHDGQCCYYLTDHLGTPLRLMNSSGQIVWSADYMAFGSARVDKKDVDNPLRLPGQFFDWETGLHYNGARYFSPELGRFLSHDPVKILTGMNFYCYSGNDPLNNADPAGLWGWPSWKTVATVAAAVAVGVIVAVTLPVSAPLAIIAAGTAAGAVGFGLNEALNQDEFCGTCIVMESLRGAGIGALASVPFALIPATASVAAFSAAGAGSGALGYMGDVLTSDGEFSWKGLATATAIGAGTGGLGRYLGGKWAQRRSGHNATGGKGHTKPTGSAGGKTTGKRTKIPDKSDHATKRSLNAENKSADQLAEAGYKVEQNPRVPDGKNPDYLIEGKRFDCKAPETARPRNAASEIEKAVKSKQADRIVLNLEDSPIKPAAMKQQLNDYQIDGLKEVILIKDGQVVPFWP